MITPQEIEQREVWVTEEERGKREQEVKQYNLRAEAYRHQMDYLQKLETSFIGVNCALPIFMIYLFSRILWLYIPLWGYLVLIANFVAALLLAFKVKNLKLATLVSLVTVLVSFWFVIIPAANAVVTYLHDKTEDGLRGQPGYPGFYDIKIRVKEAERRPIPVYRDEISSHRSAAPAQAAPQPYQPIELPKAPVNPLSAERPLPKTNPDAATKSSNPFDDGGMPTL